MGVMYRDQIQTKCYFNSSVSHVYVWTEIIGHQCSMEVFVPLQCQRKWKRTTGIPLLQHLANFSVPPHLEVVIVSCDIAF